MNEHREAVPIWQDDFDRARTDGPRGGEAVWTLVIRFRPAVRKAAGRFRFGAHDWEDFEQDLVLLVWDHIDSVAAAAAFPAWLKRVAFRHAVKFARRRRPRAVLPMIDVDRRTLDPADPSARSVEQEYFDALVRAETTRRVRSAVEELARTSPAHGAILRDYYWDGLAVAEIADKRGVPAGTVKSRLYHARRRLLEILGPSVAADVPAVCL